MRTLAPALLFLLAACSDNTGVTNVGAADAGAQDASTTNGAGPDAGAVKDSAPPVSDAPTSCDVSPAPASLPSITSSVVIAADDGGGLPPASSGGDEKATWIYTNVSIYLEPGAQGIVDPTKSSITGTGFLVFDGTRYRTQSNTELTLVTTVAGTVVRGMSTSANGTYTYTPATGTAVLTSACKVSDTTLDSADWGFSRLSDTTARFIVKAQSQIGNLTIVTDLKKGS